LNDDDDVAWLLLLTACCEDFCWRLRVLAFAFACGCMFDALIA
jgi:hypothetical protein